MLLHFSFYLRLTLLHVMRFISIVLTKYLVHIFSTVCKLHTYLQKNLLGSIRYLGIFFLFKQLSQLRTITVFISEAQPSI